MKICKKCGGNIVVNENGFEVCESCGEKYVPDEINKTNIYSTGSSEIKTEYIEKVADDTLTETTSKKKNMTPVLIPIIAIVVALAVLIPTVIVPKIKKGNEDKNASIKITDSSGSQVDFVTEANGKTAVDKDGKPITTVITSNKEESTVDASQAASQIEGSLGGLEEFKPAGKEDLIPEGEKITQAPKKPLREEKIFSVAKSGKFTLNMSIKTGDGSIPATMIVDGDKICAEMTYNKVPVRVLIMDGKMYMVMTSYKWYIEQDTEGMDGFKDLAGMATADDTLVSTTKTKDGKYICEEYKNKDGVISKYYFDANTKEWKRFETYESDNSEPVIYEIGSMSNKADSSKFSLKGYSKLDTAAFE